MDDPRGEHETFGSILKKCSEKKFMFIKTFERMLFLI